MNLHIVEFAPFTEVDSLRFLFNFENKCIYSAILIYINKSIAAKSTLVAIYDLGIIFTIW